METKLIELDDDLDLGSEVEEGGKEGVPVFVS